MQQWYQCPNCSTPVAFGVKFCANCGTQLNWPVQQQELPNYQQQSSHYQQQRYDYSKQQRRKKRSNTWLIVLGSVFAFIVLIGITAGISGRGASGPPNGTEIAAVAVTAEQLCQAYDANQVAADAMYKNKVLNVSGVVEDIGRDLVDYPEVELQGVEYSTRRYTVRCTFSTENEYLVTQLSKGQSVTIQGTCDGREMFLYAISLKDCTVMK